MQILSKVTEKTYAEIADDGKCDSTGDKDLCAAIATGGTAGVIVIALSAVAMIAAIAAVGATVKMPEKPTFAVPAISSFFSLLAFILWGQLNVSTQLLAYYKSSDNAALNLFGDTYTIVPAGGTFLCIAATVLYALSALLIFLGRKTALTISGGVGAQSV